MLTQALRVSQILPHVMIDKPRAPEPEASSQLGLAQSTSASGGAQGPFLTHPFHSALHPTTPCLRGPLSHSQPPLVASPRGR